MSAVQTVDAPRTSRTEDGWAGAPVTSDRRRELERLHHVWNRSWDTTNVRPLHGAEARTEVERPLAINADPHTAADARMPQIAERRGLRGLLQRLLRHWSPSPARYRLDGGAAGNWDVADWETLMASIANLREMGFEMSTLRVESPAARPVTAAAAPVVKPRLALVRTVAVNRAFPVGA